MNITVNRAFDIYTSVRHWTSFFSSPSTTSRVHMADLTLTFSSPVTNPRLHLVGLGGTSSSGLGYTSEFTLTTPGLTFTKIAGNSDFSVSSTQANNGNSSIEAACTGNAACGTVRVNGSNITTITLQVYIRGDGGALTWANTLSHGGDRFMSGVSLPESYTVTGNVFDDADGPGTIDGVGIGSPGGTQLYANLIDPTDNTVVGAVAVNPDGTFSFPGVPAGGVNYRVEISTIQGVQLSPAPVKTLPPGWSAVGENLGSGAGNDGTADRALSITVGSAAPLAANFGITAGGSTAADVTVGGRVRTADGRGIRNVTVMLQLSDGSYRSALTGTFGYYSFPDVPAGPVILSVRAKKFAFVNNSIFVSALDNIADLDFVANP